MHTQRLIVQIEPSAVLSVTLTLMHSAAFVCVVIFVPHWGLAGAVAVALAVSLVVHVRRHALLIDRNAITALALRDSARCELFFGNGVSMAGTVESSTFVTPWLTVVNVRTDTGQRRAAVLAPDSAPAEDRRRLRVWLRHRSRPDDRVSRSL